MGVTIAGLIAVLHSLLYRSGAVISVGPSYSGGGNFRLEK
jgi:hypothetical protein